jgi:hypothetical protein
MDFVDEISGLKQSFGSFGVEQEQQKTSRDITGNAGNFRFWQSPGMRTSLAAPAYKAPAQAV